jgi:hypothetical protein
MKILRAFRSKYTDILKGISFSGPPTSLSLMTNEVMNSSFASWVAEENTPTNGPYEGITGPYEAQFDPDAFFVPTRSPVLAYGEESDGTNISSSDVNARLGEGYAVYPFENTTSY